MSKKEKEWQIQYNQKRHNERIKNAKSTLDKTSKTAKTATGSTRYGNFKDLSNDQSETPENLSNQSSSKSSTKNQFYPKQQNSIFNSSENLSDYTSQEKV